MAPEALSDRIYSEKTDVWSFGTVVVEVLTRQIPFPALTNLAAGTKLAAGLIRPIAPQESEPIFVRLVEACTVHDPKQRINFEQACQMLNQ